MAVNVYLHAPSALPPGKERRTHLKLSEPQSQSERFGAEKSLFPLPAFEPRSVQPIHVTDCATPAPVILCIRV
jgi:hypothetical protein